MSDNTVDLNNGQKPKQTPMEQAINQLREAKIKEVQNRVNAQTKVAFDSKIVSDAEFDKLKDLIEELEFEKNRIKEFTDLTKA